MVDREARDFYEREYHFAEDAQVCDLSRKARYFKGITAPSDARILDIGCGAGVNLFHWSSATSFLFGIDLSLRALRIARTLSSGGLFAAADGQSLPFPDQTFDIVTALGVIEHFPDPHRGLTEAYRILKPGGCAVLVFPNSYGWIGQRLHYTGTEQGQELLQTLPGWCSDIESAGFEIEGIGRDSGPRIFKNWRPHKIIARILLRSTLLLPLPLAYQFLFRVLRPASSPQHP